MAFCGANFSKETKEKERAVDHSLRNVYAFSTKKNQAAPVNDIRAEGLLTMGNNKVPVDRRIKICYNDSKFNCRSYRNLTQLATELPNGKRYMGSGIHIALKGTTYALTCAHNLAGKNSRNNILVNYQDGYLYKARQGEKSWKELYKLDDKKVCVHPMFNGHADSGFDIAVCPTSTLAVNDDDRIWLKNMDADVCYGSVEPVDLKKGMKIEVAGYPGEKSGHPYTHTGEIADITKTSEGGYLLWYTADTSPGNSGSPIMILDEKIIGSASIKKGYKKQIIGIHTGHDEMAELNFGTLLTPAIEKWMEN